VVVFDPKLAGRVLRASPDRLRAGEARAERLPLLGERSVLLLDGSAHARQRRVLLPLFHHHRLSRYEAVIRTAADRAIESWPVGEPFALMPSMVSLSLEAIVRTVLGDREALLERLRKDPPATGSWAARRQVRGPRVPDELVNEEIQRRRRADARDRHDDLLAMLMLARHEDGESLSDAELHDNVSTLLEAGHHTTAIALAWTFELLLRHPPVLSRLRAALLDGDERYLAAVVKEALRIRPVVTHVQRVVGEEPFALGRYVLPPGTLVSVSIADIHRRSDSYLQANAFRPERFLGDDQIDASAWLPFGGGPRRCLGATFATFEIGVVIRRVLERTALEPLGRRPERGVVMGTVLVPKRRVRVVQPREPRPVMAARAGRAELKLHAGQAPD
jgi:cytochrome P450